MNRILALARKELLQLRRDRLTLGMVVMLPLMQLLLFGWAINTDVRHMPTIVYDQDRSAHSRDFVRRMEATGYYDVIGHVGSYDAIAKRLRNGGARVAVVVPAAYGSKLRTGETAQIQVVVDGADPLTVGSATSTSASLAAELSRTLVEARLWADGVRAPRPAVQVVPAIWYNPEQLTAVYVVPGLIGVLLTMTMVMLTAMAIARERERGTLEALIVSPTRRIEIVAGKILPYVAIGYVQMTLILMAGWWLFDVPLHGSLSLLYLLSLLFIAACLAVGLVFSTVAKTQQQAMQMSFFFLLPNILLTGFMFPFEGMPVAAQWLAEVLPLTHFLRIVRRITLRGAGLEDVVGELGWLALIFTAVVLLAAVRFKKKLI